MVKKFEMVGYFVFNFLKWTPLSEILDPPFQYYCKVPKYLDSRKIAVIILKFEQCGSTME